jgi:hypothetical protein
MRSRLALAFLAVIAFYVWQFIPPTTAQQSNATTARRWEYKVVAMASMIPGAEKMEEDAVVAEFNKNLDKFGGEGRKECLHFQTTQVIRNSND